MELKLTLFHGELTRLLRDSLPMRIVLSRPEDTDLTDDPPWFEIDHLESADFMSGYGIAITCSARVHFPVAIQRDDFTVERAQIELVPRVDRVPEGTILSFRIMVGALAIEHQPGVADQINQALTSHPASIGWNFTKTLTRMVELPPRLSLVHAVEVSDLQGTVQVMPDRIVLRLSVQLDSHEPDLTSEPTMDEDLPEPGQERP